MTEYERAAVTLARQVDLTLGKLSSRAEPSRGGGRLAP